MLSRREFIKSAAAVAAGVAGAGFLGGKFNPGALAGVTGYNKEALYYKKLGPDTVECLLCPHQCILKNGQRSLCRVREPKDGKLYTLVYELPCAMHVDPIEKKPLYHVLPASKSFSIATAGCNLRCKFCQNWQISQEYPENTINKYVPCGEAVRLAENAGCKSIAYTYSEPNIFYEYMLDTSGMARKKGIKNVWVTGGYINPDPLRELASVIDAANIDFKAFDEKYLKEVCNESLAPLLETIRLSKEKGIWVELTNLVIPTLNDDPKMIRKMCGWIVSSLGPDVPLHFSRFWPMYKLKNLPPTPLETLKNAKKIAEEEGLRFVYLGNVPGQMAANTVCPECKKILIKRMGYFVLENNIEGSKCKFCGYRVPGIWS